MENVKKINILDKNFGHSYTSSWYNKCKYFSWHRGHNIVSKCCFFTDKCLGSAIKVNKNVTKVAWLLEPRSIDSKIYKWVEKNNKLFDYVLTYDLQLVNKGENFLYYPHGMCWIDNFNDDNKTKNCSTFISSKNNTYGHILRHSIFHKFKNNKNIHFFGQYSGNMIPKKELGLNEYYFSITVENSIIPGYFTEKLIDCFATKTVPIYYGEKDKVSEFFNCESILYFNTLEDLDNILQKLSPDFYKTLTPSIIENYNLVNKYRVPENWIYEEYRFLFE